MPEVRRVKKWKNSFSLLWKMPPVVQESYMAMLSGSQIVNNFLPYTFCICEIKLKLVKKIMLLFFDTETTGLPRNWKAPVTDLNNWPRLVQLAFLLYDREGKRISEGNYIIKPEGFGIPADAARVHGITTEKAISEGTELKGVLEKFREYADRSRYLVAHNISFDEKILGAELLRNRMPDCFMAKKKICTMQTSTDFCKIQGPYGYKWPSLPELHYKLFKEKFDEAHNAMVDINATARCFWELKKLGRISLT